jgi:hypothetical protein
VAVLCKGSASVSNHCAYSAWRRTRRRHRANAELGCGGQQFADSGSPAVPRRGQGDSGLVARHWSLVYRQGLCGAWVGSEALRNRTGWFTSYLNRPHGGSRRSVFDQAVAGEIDAVGVTMRPA